MKKIILLLIVILLISSCKSKKIVSTLETTKVDSVYINRSSVVFAPVASNLAINDLCDTLTGEPKPFKSELVRGKDTIFVEVAGNSLKINVNLDSLVSSEVKKARSKWVSEKKETTETIYKTPKWAWWYMIIATILAAIGWKVWSLFQFQKDIFR